MKRSIHVTRCPEYDMGPLRKGIKEHLGRYPGFMDLSGKKVLLKVNLLSPSEPQRVVTTDPLFVKALVQEIIERGGKALIGDSPGGLFNKSSLEKVYEVTGMSRVARETGAELNYNTASHVEKLPDGGFMRSFNISDYIRSCDLTIAVPKIKTHMFTGLTCASKIMFGAVPGTEKVRYHTRFPDGVDFSKMLHDLTDLCGADLFLVDGIVGMDGKGPARGRPRKIGVIISGRDPRAIDLHIARMVGLDPSSTPVLEAAGDLGLISLSEDMEVTGEGKGFNLDQRFEPAKGSRLMTDPPRFLKRFLIDLSTGKPRISYRRCIGCGICGDNCAGDAIIIKAGKAEIDYSKCIRCYCCHELCPYNAVYISTGRSGMADRLGDIGYRCFGDKR